MAPYINDEGRDFDKPVDVRITTMGAPATVTISMPADPSFVPISINIGANSTSSVDLTAWLPKLQSTPANAVLNKGLLIQSTADITAYYDVVSGYCNCDPETFSLKGKNALGTEFFISSQYTFDESTAYQASNSFDIVATADNTHVTITPSKDIIGHNAGTPFTITLKKGQTYSAVAVSTAAGGHLQGSYITSDNPIAITLKDDLVQVQSCADLIGDQTVPTNVLGDEYIVTKGYLNQGDNIYILAVKDGTAVYIDGSATPTVTLAKGESYTLNLSNPSTYIRSSQNVYVYQLTGNGCEVGSAIIPKLNCTGSQSVSIVRSSADMFAVMITTKNGNQNNFTVNGNNSLIQGSDFSPVPGTGGAYVTAKIDLSGTTTVGSALNFSNSTGKFSLGYINGGTNDGTEYGYFSDFKSSNVQNSSVEICPGGSTQLSAYGGVTYQWAPTTGLSNPNIPNPIASPSIETNYKVTITSADGCIDYANVDVKISNGLTPSVTIAASATDICAGTPVTFTATPVNGGLAPVYQWMINGVNAGTNSATFSSNILINGDKVTCKMTSNALCATPASVTSNSITINVASGAPASVAIAASQNNVCAGTNVTFTATPVNGSANPSYKWFLNGIYTGTNGPTFTSSYFVNGDVVTCEMSFSSPCTASTVNSNAVTMVVNPDVTPSVSITADKNNVCTGTTINFTATPLNGGSAPSYQWMVNGVNTGTNSPYFSSKTFVNGDNVTCVLTSNANCITANTATSNSVLLNINTDAAPSVTIAASTTTICTGGTVMFTATPVNGGNAPIYQWMVNGVAAGTNSSTFSTTALVNGDVVNCIIKSNAPCVTVPAASSNNVAITVNPQVSPSITIAPSDNNFCAGATVTFTSSATNEGSAPVYQWLVNGNETGTNTSTFTSSSLKNNDVVSCRLTGNASCAVPASVVSNGTTMIVNTLPEVSGGGDKIIEKGASVRLSATVSANVTSVIWSPVTGLDNAGTLTPLATPDKTTIYTITAQSAEGCSNTASVKVTVQESVIIPNTFTPNDDGVNDTWEIKNLADYPNCDVKIFTRWGEEIYRSKGYYTSWDGTYKGKRVPYGTYYYIIKLNNGTSPLSGFVAVIK